MHNISNFASLIGMDSIHNKKIHLFIKLSFEKFQEWHIIAYDTKGNTQLH